MFKIYVCAIFLYIYPIYVPYICLCHLVLYLCNICSKYISVPLSFILIQSMFNISVCATNNDDVLPHHHCCMETSLLAEIFNESVNSEWPFPILIPEGKVALSQQYVVPGSTYEWHCYSYYTQTSRYGSPPNLFVLVSTRYKTSRFLFRRTQQGSRWLQRGSAYISLEKYFFLMPISKRKWGKEPV